MRYIGGIGIPNTKSKVNSKDIIITDQFDENLLSANLNSNIVESKYKDFILDFFQMNDPYISFGRECKKYHFYYKALAHIDRTKWVIRSITLKKMYLIRILDKTHFVVKNDFSNNSAEIRITDNDFTSKEIKMKLNAFNLTRVKHIDKKLNSILLLT
jgi:hypothetical protein